MGFPVILDSSVPPDAESPRAGALRIRNLTQALLDLLGITSGTPITAAPFTIAPDGTVTIPQDAIGTTLTNKTGVTLSPGDVVTFDATTDSAVALSDFSGSLVQFAVALALIAPNAAGSFATNGVCQKVAVTGAITRGHYLRKSATTKVAEDTGVIAASGTAPPAGAFALALTGGSVATVVALLLGSTVGTGAVNGARVYRSTNQAIPGATDTALIFDTTRYNIGTLWAAGNPSRLTLPQTGRYIVGGNVQWTAVPASAQVRIRVDGTTNLAKARTDDQSGNVNTVYSFTAGQYVELVVRNSGGGTVQADPNESPEFWAQFQSG